MKKYFFTGIVLLVLFEVLKVYLIMPFPGSQTMDSLNVAYFMYRYRWIFRLLFIGICSVGFADAWGHFKKTSAFLILLTLFMALAINYGFTAEQMFHIPEQMAMASAETNIVDSNRIVLGIVIDGKPRAYPIQYLGYHHQVYDTVNGNVVLPTYCTVCRSGRVFIPNIDGHIEKFRLVGMTHFNAMLEDASSKSWWQQATGECVAGKQKGKRMAEIPSTQTSLANWLKAYPTSRVMQPDNTFSDKYAELEVYESTPRMGDTIFTNKEWSDKTWIVGIKLGANSAAVQYNVLKKQRYLLYTISQNKVAVFMSNDNKGLACYVINNATGVGISNDTISIDGCLYNFMGKPYTADCSELLALNTYLENWHSWQQFNHSTEQILGP